MNALLAYNNWCFKTDATVDTSTGDATGTPANNLLKPQLSKACVWTRAGSGSGDVSFEAVVTFAADDPSSQYRPVRVVGLLGLRLRQLGALLGLNAEAAAVAAVTIQFVGRNASADTMFDTGEIPVRWYTDLGFEPKVMRVLDQTYDVVDMVVVIRIAGYASQTVKVSGGALWASPAFWTTTGLEESWTIELDDPGTMAKSKGQQGYASKSTKCRVVNASWAPVSFDVAFGEDIDGSPGYVQDPSDMQRVQSIVGTTDPCVLFVRTLNADNAWSNHIARRLGVYGHFSVLGPITDQGGNQFKWGSFVFKELL